jgi:hypothetical protein
VTRTTSVNNQFAHVGLAAYAAESVARDRKVAERVARLLVDPRWPWIPWWAQIVGLHKRDDRPAIRVGGKNGFAPLVEGMMSPQHQKLLMNRAMGDKDYSSVRLPFDPGRLEWGGEAPYALLVTCRSAELPEGKTFDAWLSLAHELVTAVGAVHAILGAWPTYDMAIGDTWLTRMVLDTPKGDIPLGLPSDFREQASEVASWAKKIGRTFARYPRWGTYLNAEHVLAVGGVERIRTEVQPAKIEVIGDLTYIQLTDSIDSALTADAGEKRRRLQTLMEPILVGNLARLGEPPGSNRSSRA